jgi:hypothetical protein
MTAAQLELPGIAPSSPGRRRAAERQRRRTGPPADASPSRFYANNFSAGSDQGKRRDRRRSRDRLREVLNDVSTLKRCHNCGWAEANDGNSQGPQIAARDGVAYWRGVQTCGSIWACPACAAKIRNGRAIEISEFAAEWINRGNEVYMVTLTAPHDLGMALGALMTLIIKAFTYVIGGRKWVAVRDQLGIAGCIRALEVTHGPNGWHPHLHVLVFVEGQLDAAGRCAFEVHFRDQWGKFVTRRGYRPPSGQHGVKVERCYSGGGAAEYIAKTQDGKSPGNEMARADMKTPRSGHRVPFDILAAAGTGEKAELALWHEYEKATHRHRAITWSPVLRKLQKEWLAVEEKTDDELAAEVVDGDVVADVSPAALRGISCKPGLRVGLLEAWEDEGLPGVQALAAAHGFMLTASRVGPPKLHRLRGS